MLDTIEKYYLLLLIYSFAGWIWESVICALIFQKKLINSGFFIGPYCPIYGFGALLDIIVLGWIKDPILLFFASAFICCIMEYITSYVMEKLFNARWWDYSDMKFNINGRVCLLGFVAFGILSVLLTKYIDPFIESLIIATPETLIHTGCIVSAVIITIDVIITLKSIKGFNDKLRVFTEALLEKGSALSETIIERQSVISETLAEKKNAVTDAISEKKSAVTDKLQSTAAYEKLDAIKKYI